MIESLFRAPKFEAKFVTKLEAKFQAKGEPKWNKELDCAGGRRGQLCLRNAEEAGCVS